MDRTIDIGQTSPMTRLLKIEKGRGPDLEIFVISVSKFLHFWIQRGRKPRKYRGFKKF